MKNIGVIGNESTLKNKNYYCAVKACKANVIKMDPYDMDADIRGIVSGLDGLIIPGGCDIDPAYYHEENVASEGIDERLDSYELEALKEAVSIKLPILGICRGHQLLNVFFGGTLHQNIFCCSCHKRHEHKDRVHETKARKGSFIYDIYGTENVSVNSAHHQAIKVPGEGIIPVQYSGEGIIEAIIHEEMPIYGVQWHPERMCLANHRDDTVDGLKIFEYFISK